MSELELNPTQGPLLPGSATSDPSLDVAPAPDERPSSVTASAASVIAEILETVVLTLVIFFLVRTVVQNYRIDGDSMETNFHNGQYLIISKLAYRFGEPRHGDVVIFRFPRDPSRDFIKRVVGLPGEKVEVRRGEVFIDGRSLPEPYQPRMGSYDADPVVLGSDEVYVLGDNRNNSLDSHAWGPLPLKNIIGKALLSYWPPKYWSLVPKYLPDAQ